MDMPGGADFYGRHLHSAGNTPRQCGGRKNTSESPWFSVLNPGWWKGKPRYPVWKERGENIRQTCAWEAVCHPMACGGHKGKKPEL